MTIDEAETAIVELFLEEWNNRLPVALDNDIEDSRKTGWDEFVHLSVQEDDSRQESLGNVGARRFRRFGKVFARVHAKLGKGGTQVSSQHAQRAREILEARRVADDLILTAAVPRRVGPVQRWFVTNVEAQFDYEEVK